jgi:hypothetical protein
MDTPRERINIDLRVGGRYELTMVQRGGGAEFTMATIEGLARRRSFARAGRVREKMRGLLGQSRW